MDRPSPFHNQQEFQMKPISMVCPRCRCLVEENSPDANQLALQIEAHPEVTDDLLVEEINVTRRLAGKPELGDETGG